MLLAMGQIQRNAVGESLSYMLFVYLFASLCRGNFSRVVTASSLFIYFQNLLWAWQR